MIRTLMGSALTAAALAFTFPSTGVAQTPQDGWWEWAVPMVMGGQQVDTRRGIVVIPQPRNDRDARDARRGGQRGQGQARGRQGPPFCQNGQGHPVHGRQWCVQQGFGLGGRGAYDPRWERRGWEDIIFGTPRDRRTRATMDQGTLIDVLGGVVFGRLQGHGHRLGAHDPLTGRWVQDSSVGARVLQVRAGGVPIAELTDLNGDGRVDVVLLNPGG